MGKIDSWLKCEETDAPFSHCIHCRVALLEIDDDWLVNKEYDRGECVLEYAICKPCRDKVTSDLSEESKQTVRRFLETEIPWEERMVEFVLHLEPANRFSHCVACRTDREACGGFGISAQFDSGGHLVEGPLPLLICHDCIRRITSSMSAESRDVWRRFLRDHFAGPPDGSNIPDDGLPGFF